MSRIRPVTYLPIEQLATLSTQRLRAYKRRLKETGGGLDDGEPRQWGKLLKLVDRVLRERSRETWAKLSRQERVAIALGFAEEEGYERPRAQLRAHKRNVQRFLERNERGR